MLEKGGGFAIRIFPKGLVLVPIPSNGIHIVLSVFVKFFVNSTNTHISLSHTVHDKEIWDMVFVKDMCRGMVHTVNWDFWVVSNEFKVVRHFTTCLNHYYTE